MKNTGLYNVVSVDFLDKLKLFMSQNKQIRIWYILETGKKKKADIVIRDIITEKRCEYLLTEEMPPLRLDCIIEADGIIVRHE